MSTTKKRRSIVKGAYLQGPKHSEGGIPVYNRSNPDSAVEVEGGEVVITAPAVEDDTLRSFNGQMMTNREILSEINQSGGGVALEKGGSIPSRIHCSGKMYEYGGEILSDYDIVDKCGCAHSMYGGGQLLPGSESETVFFNNRTKIFQLWQKFPNTGWKRDIAFNARNQADADNLISYWSDFVNIPAGNFKANPITKSELDKNRISLRNEWIYQAVMRKNKPTIPGHAELLQEFKKVAETSKNNYLFELYRGREDEMITLVQDQATGMDAARTKVNPEGFAYEAAVKLLNGNRELVLRAVSAIPEHKKQMILKAWKGYNVPPELRNAVKSKIMASGGEISGLTDQERRTIPLDHRNRDYRFLDSTVEFDHKVFQQGGAIPVPYSTYAPISILTEDYIEPVSEELFRKEGNRIAKKINTDAGFELLDSDPEIKDSTWSSGGCYPFARAMQKMFGGKLMFIYDRGIAQHVMLNIGDLYLDSDGVYGIDKKLKIAKREGMINPWLGEFDESNIGTIGVGSDEFVQRIIDFCRPNKMEEGGQLIALPEHNSHLRKISLSLKNVDNIPNVKISSSKDIYDLLIKIWDKESMNVLEMAYALFLDISNGVIGYIDLSKGGINATIMDPAIVAGLATSSLAKNVVIAHNHPSGNLRPSAGDMAVTKKLAEGLKLLDIKLLDHIIVSPNGSYYSFLDQGDLVYARGGKIKAAFGYANAFELNRAIEKLLDDQPDNSSFTIDQKEFIRYYSGYGGLEKFGATGKGLLYEYFTPPGIAEPMWGLAYKYGYTGGDVCEPSAGIDEFVKYAPDQRVDAYEINPYSARILKILYPNTIVHTTYFEELFIKNRNTIKNKVAGLKKYQLVIGNPP